MKTQGNVSNILETKSASWRRRLIPFVASLSLVACANNSEGTVKTPAPQGSVATADLTDEDSNIDNENNKIEESADIKIDKTIFNKPLPEFDMGLSEEEILKHLNWFRNRGRPEEFVYILDIQKAIDAKSVEKLIDKGYTKKDLIYIWYIAAQNANSLNSLYQQKTEEGGLEGTEIAFISYNRSEHIAAINLIKQMQSEGLLNELPDEAKATSGVDLEYESVSIMLSGLPSTGMRKEYAKIYNTTESALVEEELKETERRLKLYEDNEGQDLSGPELSEYWYTYNIKIPDLYTTLELYKLMKA